MNNDKDKNDDDNCDEDDDDITYYLGRLDKVIWHNGSDLKKINFSGFVSCCLNINSSTIPR